MGTITDAYAMLRILFSRCSAPYVGPSTAFSFNVPTVSGAGAIKVGDKKAKKATFESLGGMCPGARAWAWSPT